MPSYPTNKDNEHSLLKKIAENVGDIAAGSGGGGGIGAVDSVNGQTGAVVLDSDDIGGPSDAEFSALVADVENRIESIETSSLDGQIIVFDGITGKQARKDTTTGLPILSGGVITAAVAGTDFVAPGAATTSGLTMATARLLGRTTASTGAPEEITVGSGLSLAAGSLSASGGGDFSSNTATSVADEIVLFADTSGKLGKRSTATGLTKLTGGVLSAATAGTDYELPGGDSGSVWFPTGLITSVNFYGVAYANGRFVAAPSTGGANVYTSDDGTSWTARQALGGSNQIPRVTYGKGLFVMTQYLSATNCVWTSPDGVTWTQRTCADLPANALCYGGGQFIVMGTSTSVLTSPDGIVWTERTSKVAGQQWFDVTYGNGLYVGVSVDGTNRVATSPDGITWTARSAASALQWAGVTYGKGLFVACSQSSSSVAIMTSPDGITWTSRTTPGGTGYGAVHFADGVFISAAYNSSAGNIRSVDGITWVAQTAATGSVGWTDITYGDGMWVTVSPFGAGASLHSAGSGSLNFASGPFLGSDYNYPLTVHGVGTAYVLTNTAAAADFGTTDPTKVLDKPGTYLILAQINLSYNAATVAAETATIKVRRTNNTAADVSAVVVLDLPSSTIVTNTYGIFQIPPFIYSTANANDSLSIFANVSATLSAGSVDATAIGTSIVAIKLS